MIRERRYGIYGTAMAIWAIAVFITVVAISQEQVSASACCQYCDAQLDACYADCAAQEHVTDDHVGYCESDCDSQIMSTCSVGCTMCTPGGGMPNRCYECIAYEDSDCPYDEFGNRLPGPCSYIWHAVNCYEVYQGWCSIF